MTTVKKQRVTVFLNPSIFKHAKAQAVVEETSLTLLIERALIRYLPKETTIRKIKIREEMK
jgi:peptide deformylase